MTATVFNVEGGEGGSVVVRVRIQEADGTTADLTGYTGTMQVRADPLDPDILAEGVVTFADGVVTGTIDSADTLAWSAGYYDVRIVSADGVVEYPIGGRITLQPTVTQP